MYTYEFLNMYRYNSGKPSNMQGVAIKIVLCTNKVVIQKYTEMCSRVEGNGGGK